MLQKQFCTIWMLQKYVSDLWKRAVQDWTGLSTENKDGQMGCNVVVLPAGQVGTWKYLTVQKAMGGENNVAFVISRKN